MGKNGTKRKTKWRTLPIGSGAANTADIKEERIDDEKVKQKRDSTNYTTEHTTNGFTKTPTSSDSSNNENHHSSNQHYNNKYHSYNNNYSYPYKRRPFSSRSNYYGGSKEDGSGGGYGSYYKTNTRNNNEAVVNNNKDDSTTKPTFNEDDYTRITTPRQDVLFKKGYLSRPKRTFISTDTNTSSSGAVSVVSTEESATPSSQSFSPEHCTSIPEMHDQDYNPFAYPSFVDQNGLVYVNPYMSTGFDPYGGPMMMMPYASANSQPFSINPIEFYDNTQNATPYQNDKKISTDSQLTADDGNPIEAKSTTPIADDCSNDDPLSNSIETSQICDSASLKSDEKHSGNPSPPCQFHSMGMQQFCPPYFYQPYIYSGVPFSMSEGNYNDINEEIGASYDNINGSRQYRFKKRKRKPRPADSTEATTTECSEDESTDEDNIDSNEESPEILTQETANSFITYGNVTQFFEPVNYLPKTVQKSSHLNAEVKEFLPRNYKSASTKIVEEPEVKVIDEVKETVVINKNPFVEQIEKISQKEIKQKKSDLMLNKGNVTKVSENNKKSAIIEEKPERIKKTSNEPTWAQLLNGKEEKAKTNSNAVKKIEKKIEEPIAVKTMTVSITEAVKPKWQTVKIKGRRGKTPESNNVWEDEEKEEETITEEILNESTISIETISADSSINSDSTSNSSINKIKVKKSKSKNKKSAKKIVLKMNGFEVIEPTFTVPIFNKKIDLKLNEIESEQEEIEEEEEEEEEINEELLLEAGISQEVLLELQKIDEFIDSDNEEITDEVIDTVIAPVYESELKEIEIFNHSSVETIIETELPNFNGISEISSLKDEINGFTESVIDSDENTDEKILPIPIENLTETKKIKEIIEKSEIVVNGNFPTMNGNCKSTKFNDILDKIQKPENIESINNKTECLLATEILIENCNEISLQGKKTHFNGEVFSKMNGNTIPVTEDIFEKSPKTNGVCLNSNESLYEIDFSKTNGFSIEIEEIPLIKETSQLQDDKTLLFENNNTEIPKIIEDNLNRNVPLLIQVLKNEEEKIEKIEKPKNEDQKIKDCDKNETENMPSSDSEQEKNLPEILLKFPITEAVSRWLEKKQKEKTPEPILRIPDDPMLSEKIGLTILGRNRTKRSTISSLTSTDEDDDFDFTTDSEIEYEEPSKNLKSNPLPVSSVNYFPLKENDEFVVLKNLTVDTDSDYMSDGQKNDDRTSKRVAKINLDGMKMKNGCDADEIDGNDFLEYWDELDLAHSSSSLEPKEQILSNKNNNLSKTTNILTSSCNDNFEVYDSVYGKTISYKNLLINETEFLSNNININDKCSSSNNHQSLLDSKHKNNGKDKKHKSNDKKNCLKPPFTEVCCVLM